MTRKIHLLFALFLSPWVFMYAVSAIMMQHRTLFYGSTERVPPPYHVVDQIASPVPITAGTATAEVAEKLLQALKIEGAHRFNGSVEAGRIEINRDRPIGSYRVTWRAGTNEVTVEKQAFGLAYFLEMLHRRRGFQEPLWANDAWAAIVDLVVVAVLAWTITGIMMWWKIAPTRKFGTLAVLSGSFLFAYFLLAI